MGRPTLHQPRDFVAAAQRLAAAGGAEVMTMGAVARATGAPVGSLYHRFSSREALLAAAWLDAQGAFQAGFLAALRSRGRQPGLEAALLTTEWARADPVRARLLVLRRPAELGSERWGEAERARAAGLRADLEGGLADFCQAHLGGGGGEQRRLATFAVLDLPFAAVHRYLAVGMAPPVEVDRYLALAIPALIPAVQAEHTPEPH